MSNLSMHLFKIVDDTPIYCPVQINLPCFRDLYITDTTSDKSEYAKQLVFIWYYLDANSPYMYSDNKLEECLKAAFGTVNYKISALLKSCMDEYSKRQSTPELRSLQTVMELLDESLKSLKDTKRSSDEELRYLEDLDKQIKVQKDLKERRMLLLMQTEAKKNMNDVISNITQQIPKITNIIKEMAELKKAVQASLSEIDSSTNKESISNHIIYDIIDTFRNK